MLKCKYFRAIYLKYKFIYGTIKIENYVVRCNIMKIGTMVHLGDNVVAKIREVKKYGMESFQLCCWNFSLFTDEMAQAIRAAAD